MLNVKGVDNFKSTLGQLYIGIIAEMKTEFDEKLDYKTEEMSFDNQNAVEMVPEKQLHEPLLNQL